MGTPDITRRRVAVNGVELDLLEAGEGPLVVLCHGFPELATSWRHQLTALAAAGYHAVAPDQRGYADSSRPTAVEDYDLDHLAGDIIGLVDEAGAEQAVVVGHDWGSNVAWGTAQRHPDRVAGVVGMSVPFLPRGDRPPTQLLRLLLAGQWFYILYFQEPGVADAELDADPREVLRRMYAGLAGDVGAASLGDQLADDGRGFVDRLPDPGSLPAWLTDAHLDETAAAFTRSGFTGPLNWYRNMDRNWELSAGLDPHIHQPALFVAGAADLVLAMTPPSSMDGLVDDLRGTILVDGAGHWVQEEKAEAVDDALLGFLGGLPAWR
jgi:pimeloyl-ACP methyl ester carboxylesterase